MTPKIGNVFISHSAKEPDHSVAKSLATALDEVGFNVWWDEEGLEGGNFFPVEILEAIIRQHFFLFILSPRSVVSKWCLRELVRATELNKDIKPLVLEQVPPERSPLELAGLQYVKISAGIQTSLPAVLKSLGIGVNPSQASEDPFSRDAHLLRSIADQLNYAKTFTGSLNMVRLLQKIGVDNCETDRARKIFQGMLSGEHFSPSGGVRSIDYDKVRSYLLNKWSE